MEVIQRWFWSEIRWRNFPKYPMVLKGIQGHVLYGNSYSKYFVLTVVLVVMQQQIPMDHQLVGIATQTSYVEKIRIRYDYGCVQEKWWDTRATTLTSARLQLLKWKGKRVTKVVLSEQSRKPTNMLPGMTSILKCSSQSTRERELTGCLAGELPANPSHSHTLNSVEFFNKIMHLRWCSLFS